MKLSDFDYDLPGHFIAQQPAEPRDSSRLMVLDKSGITHRMFRDILDYFECGDVIVLNDTRVLPARLSCRKSTGGKVELLMMNLTGLKQGASPCIECLVRGRVRVGTELVMDPFPYNAKVVEHLEEGRFIVEFRPARASNGDDLVPAGDFIDHIDRYGQLPLPPYIKETPAQQTRYQTVYSACGGSIAAPTAGLHFTEGLIRDMEKKGVRFCHITLHISYGTFKPVRSGSVEEHKMDLEYYRVTAEAAELLNEGRRTGKLTAVGTTCVRTLESIYRENDTAEACEGVTDLFIYPGYRFRSGITGMITNFHFPRSTLLMLVSALAGRERMMEAYEVAKKEGYRFYSFGDAMLLRDL